MPYICYKPKRFQRFATAVIEAANQIIAEYAKQGYDLTLRQLYYQFVARDMLPNTVKEYKRLGAIISDARKAGLIDWNTIVDRTRELRGLQHWEDPKEIIDLAAEHFRLDVWAQQPRRIEVWVEKDALLGVFEQACNPWRVSYFSCRGYSSDSAMWRAAQRLNESRGTLVLHFSDHDPSGLDMSMDIGKRLGLFETYNTEVKRVALQMSQVEEHGLPPNPAKEVDPRFKRYQQDYGDESWELDALDPKVLTKLVEEHVKRELDMKAWNAVLTQEEAAKQLLVDAAENVEQEWNDLDHS